jgi:hypothetical protein
VIEEDACACCERRFAEIATREGAVVAIFGWYLMKLCEMRFIELE